MGPITVIDKSALQSLSPRQLSFLRKHYYVVIPPVLIEEVLGDLYKQSPEAMTRHEAMVLAGKLEKHDSSVCGYFRDIAMDSLIGGRIPMDGRIPRPGGVPITSKDGRKGFFFDESPEERALDRWRRTLGARGTG